jgi:hypothetical protein
MSVKPTESELVVSFDRESVAMVDRCSTIMDLDIDMDVILIFTKLG